MEQDPRQKRQFVEARAVAEPQNSGDGFGLDRVVTAVAFLVTVALILISPLAG